MASLLQEIELAGERVAKYTEATVIDDAMNTLSTIAAEGDAWVATVPELANDLVKAAENAASKYLSGAAAAQVNVVLASLGVDLAAEAEKVAEAILGAVSKIVAGGHSLAAKLRAEADATKSE